MTEAPMTVAEYAGMIPLPLKKGFSSKAIGVQTIIVLLLQAPKLAERRRSATPNFEMRQYQRLHHLPAAGQAARQAALKRRVSP
jgi:hypothetical protein